MSQPPICLICQLPPFWCLLSEHDSSPPPIALKRKKLKKNINVRWQSLKLFQFPLSLSQSFTRRIRVSLVGMHFRSNKRASTQLFKKIVCHESFLPFSKGKSYRLKSTFETNSINSILTTLASLKRKSGVTYVEELRNGGDLRYSHSLAIWEPHLEAPTEPGHQLNSRWLEQLLGQIGRALLAAMKRKWSKFSW